MPAREHILHKIRTALGRNAGQPPAPAPPPRLAFAPASPAELIRQAIDRFPGKAVRADSDQEARDYVASQINGSRAIASPAPLLDRLGILTLPGVAIAAGGPDQVQRACAESDIGITTAEYVLADTGALVTLAGVRESRLVSLLPPVHIAVGPADRILTGLEELFTLLPDPATLSSSLVLIAGPSRTADVEGVLTLGVHGPRELHLVLVQ